MYKQGKYKETDKMSDLICENYPMVLVMSRFGITGFGEKNIKDVCRQNEVDCCTFLTVVNFLSEEISGTINEINNCLSLGSLITYLHNAHDYFLNFRLPHIRRKLTEAITGCPGDIASLSPNSSTIMFMRSINSYVVRRKDRLPLRPQPVGRGERYQIQYQYLPQTARPDRDEDRGAQKYPAQILSRTRQLPAEQCPVRHLCHRTRSRLS